MTTPSLRQLWRLYKVLLVKSEEDIDRRRVPPEAHCADPPRRAQVGGARCNADRQQRVANTRNRRGRDEDVDIEVDRCLPRV